MSASSTLGHAAIRDLYAALEKLKRMFGDTETIQWEVVKAVESIEDWLDPKQAIEPLQEELGFD